MGKSNNEWRPEEIKNFLQTCGIVGGCCFLVYTFSGPIFFICQVALAVWIGNRVVSWFMKKMDPNSRNKFEVDNFSRHIRKEGMRNIYPVQNMAQAVASKIITSVTSSISGHMAASHAIHNSVYQRAVS